MRRARRTTGPLDTGPPDPWSTQPPDHVMRQTADEIEADHLANGWDLTA